MKKVGLITFHDTTNFGSFLQTLGLYRTIVSLGYDCKVIDYKCERIADVELPARKPQSCTPRDIAKFILFEPIKWRKYNAFQKALSSQMKLTMAYERGTISQVNKDLDIFVVGSDILWDLTLVNGDTSYFLDFTDDDKGRIAFSTSVGEEWSDAQKEKLLPLVKRFNHIALREQTSARWMEKLAGQTVQHVCDPTMMVKREDWEQYANQSKNGEIYRREKYVLVYFPDNRILKDADTYAQKNGLQVWCINYGLPIRGVKNVAPVTIEDFLAMVQNAKMVLTASYHGMLFSIYFHIPFYAYLIDGTHNERLISLLEKLNLCDRLRNENATIQMSAELNFECSSKIIDEWRAYSINLLSDFLGELNSSI